MGFDTLPSFVYRLPMVKHRMKENWVRRKVISGETAVGCFVGLGSPNVAELLAHVGYEWLLIETEHNSLDSAQVEHMLMAIQGTDTIPLVRVPPADLFAIQRSLDQGAMGVMVPMVKTPAEAEAIVAATRYPPEGKRGFGPVRASRYTLGYDSYLDRANENILVALILETVAAVEVLQDIASVPGVDVLYMGLWDLCLDMGLDPRQLPHPETDAVIKTALKVGEQTGTAIGIGCATPDEFLQRESQGFSFMACGSDLGLLIQGATPLLETYRTSRPSKD